MKNLGKTSKAFAVALVIASILTLTFSAKPVHAQPTGNEMLFANPSTISRKDLLTGDTLTMNISAANMTRITTLACSLTWDPYYLNLTSIVVGGCLPGGSLLIGDRNYTQGWMTDITYGVLGNYYDITLGTAFICTFQIKHPGYSMVDIWGMSCWSFDLYEVLTGDSLYDGTVNIIEVRSWPIDYNNDTVVEHYVVTESNSTIATPVNFTIVSESEGYILFNVSGKTGSRGYTNVTIDKLMLNAEPVDNWHTFIDGALDDSGHQHVSDATKTYVWLSYNHSEHSVRILGNKVIPEFPSTTLLLLMLTVTAAMFVLTRKVHKKPWQTALKR